MSVALLIVKERRLGYSELQVANVKNVLLCTQLNVEATLC